jgi:CDP-diacylglycerol--serine O-phosphatidyltransferase
MLGFYNYTTWLTYLGLVCGVFGIGFAAGGHETAAIVCLCLAGFFDLFDGKVASTKKDRTDDMKRFGIQIDSLCDVICFGVLPSAIGVSLVASQSLSVRIGVWALAALYILCGLIRLAYFNVTEETRQAKEGGRRTHFQGVPITTAAVVFPLVYGVDELLFSFGGISAAIAPWLYPAFLFITGAAFITPVRVRKPRGVGLTILGIIGLCEFGFMLWLLLR